MLQAFDRAVTPLLNDPRDTVFVRFMAACSLMLVLAGGLFYLGTFPVWLGLGYLALWGFAFVDRFTLMLHCTSHRPLFKKRFGPMNQIIPWVLCPFFGQSPETYFAHHMGMHHVEGNLPGDLSSTMKYQRDSLVHWLRYFLRFFFFCAIELPIYHVKKHHPKLARRTVIGEYSFLLACAAGLYLRPLPTLFVFVIPFVLIRFLMMAGNWGQHAFIDPLEADNDFKSSITCINVRYNTRCFNDGYHIIHHLKPALHYTEMDKEFEANRAKYGAQDAIVFSGIDFFGVWVMLMLGRYRTLAKAFVQLPGAPERSEDEIIALFKHRLAPIRGWQPAKASQAHTGAAATV